ncbi:MAG: GGDEF domain-containing protein [Myxococcota bacterium]
MTGQQRKAETERERGGLWLENTEPVSIVPLSGALDGLTPCLIVLTNPHLGQVVPVTGGPVTIGRGTEAGFTVREASISREHVRLTRLNDGQIELCDLASTNGTFVNGERVQRCIIQAGDRIQLGRATVLKLDFIGELEGEFHNQLYEAGTRDALTGLFNRRYFDQHLDTEFRLAERHSESLTLVLVDLDHFKQVNDTHGHLAGDMVLRSFANLLTKRCRREDIIARYGGEEFVLLLRRTSVEGATAVAESVRAIAQTTTLTYQNTQLRFTVSLGIATREIDGGFGSGEDLLRAADEALYRAKEGGRNRLEHYTNA